MQLRPHLLDQWIARYAGADCLYNLAGSTGPSWTIDELLALEPGSESRLRSLTISYQPSAGQPTLRDALATMSGAAAEQFVVTGGGAEALFHVFLLAARPGGNVVVPHPGFSPYLAVPEAFGLEVRTYSVTAGGFDIAQIRALTDSNTSVILVNSPHNPTGAVVAAGAMQQLSEFASDRSVQLVCDEVFHPIYHGQASPSAATLPHVTVVSDLSKAFALPGLRIGWIREPDASRRAQYVNAREYLSISNSAMGEFLGQIAVKHHPALHGRTQEAASANLLVLEALMRGKAAVLEWTTPAGGTTAWIRFKNTTDTRPFCEAAAEKGLVLVPGDCFGVPDHVRVGIGIDRAVFTEGARRLCDLI